MKKDDKAQILILTGVIIILLTFAIATMSTDLSNVEVEQTSERTHSLQTEFFMVKERFVDLLGFNYASRKTDEFHLALNETIDEFERIEAHYHIDFYAETNRTSLPATITLGLRNDDTNISQKFVFAGS